VKQGWLQAMGEWLHPGKTRVQNGNAIQTEGLKSDNKKIRKEEQ